jgi:hypothetical protein
MSEKFTQGHAVIIGVGADLPNTITDAAGLADIIKDPDRCAYPEAQVHLMAGAAATRDNILKRLELLAQEADANSTVVFYFSGHGYQADTTVGRAFYLMPYGYDLARLYQTAVSGAELTERLRNISAQKMLVLLDCCHAGEMERAKAPGVQLTKTPLPLEANTLLGQGSGRVIIASSKAEEVSYAGNPYSAFTLALIEALAGRGAAKQDGYVRAADLALYAREMVPKRTKDRQHPILNFEQADNFVIAYYAGGAAQPKELPFSQEPEIELEPRAFNVFNQSGQKVYGPQTNIMKAEGPIFSGNFQGPVRVGGLDTIDTDGGAYVSGDITIGGDFVGRDKVVHGDEVGGDKISGDKITVGNISGQGIAIGRGATANVTTGIPAADLDKLFAPLMNLVETAPASKRDEAIQAVAALREEVAKGKKADDSRIGKLIDRLGDLAPEAVSAVVSAFTSPILGGLAGPVTQFVLDKIQGR